MVERGGVVVEGWKVRRGSGARSHGTPCSPLALPALRERERVAKGWTGGTWRVAGSGWRMEGEEGELISSTHAHWAAPLVSRDSPGIPHNIPSRPTPLACALPSLHPPPLPSTFFLIPERPLYLRVLLLLHLLDLSRRAAIPATGLSNVPRENGELFFSLLPFSWSFTVSFRQTFFRKFCFCCFRFWDSPVYLAR